MTMPFFQVDAFASRPFAGNPAAVMPLKEWLPDETLAAIAAEHNLAETAFFVPQGRDFHLRWFTPTVEMPLCGHATLASAHVLWKTGAMPKDATIRFRTRSGVLTAKLADGWIELDFPLLAADWVDVPPGLDDVLGSAIAAAATSRFDLLVELKSEGAVRDLKPDLAQLARQPYRGVIVTAKADRDDEYDFVSRFFAPQSGVPEDPVTGSAHCVLAPYWGERLGHTRMIGRQLSARGGIVKVEVSGDRVLLGGQAVTTLRGELAEG